MRLSIVSTLYYSAPYLREFYARVCAEAGKLTEAYEIIFVNDGSPDESLEIALSLYELDDRVRVIDLSRNFGHHKAIMTGLAQAQGDLVFLIDCDLEEEPEWLSKFYEESIITKADVIYGVQQKRRGGFFERVSGELYYTLYSLLADYPVPHNVTIARLMSQRYAASLAQHREQEINLLGLCIITGFVQAPVMVQKHHKGSSTYNLRRKIAAFVNAVTSFSNKPLIYIFYLGCGVSSLSIAAAGYLILRRLLFGVFLAGWPSLIVSVWLLGGLTLICLGIIGIYLSKIFMETKQRPYTIVRQFYGQRRDGSDKLQSYYETALPQTRSAKLRMIDNQ